MRISVNQKHAFSDGLAREKSGDLSAKTQKISI